MSETTRDEHNLFEGSQIAFSTNTVVEYVSERKQWSGYVSLYVTVTKSDTALLVENFESDKMYNDDIMKLFNILPEELQLLINKSQLLNNMSQQEDRLTTTLTEAGSDKEMLVN